jgi:hypothetical protein
MTDPLSRILDAGLELARQELEGRVLDDDERAALDFCDDMGGVRGIAEDEARMDDDRDAGIRPVTDLARTRRARQRR